MYKSLSQTISKIEKQALKLKNKIVDKSHRAEKVGEATSRGAEVSPSPSTPRIINARRYAVKPMTADEAALVLDGDENQFLVFRNSENQRISVIYKRKDGNYGLVQP
jgi:putative sigma-54 modulation protein